MWNVRFKNRGTEAGPNVEAVLCYLDSRVQSPEKNVDMAGWDVSVSGQRYWNEATEWPVFPQKLVINFISGTDTRLGRSVYKSANTS